MHIYLIKNLYNQKQLNINKLGIKYSKNKEKKYPLFFTINKFKRGYKAIKNKKINYYSTKQLHYKL